MPMPTDVPIIDCMIGFPANDFSQYEFIRKQLKDSQSRDSFDFPVEYMFKNVPKELYGTENPIDVTLHEMDRFGVEKGLIGVGGDVSAKAIKDHPDRFIPSGSVDPNDGMEGIRRMVQQYEEFGVRAFGAFPPAAIHRSRSMRHSSIRSTRNASSSACRSSFAPAFRARASRWTASTSRRSTASCTTSPSSSS